MCDSHQLEPRVTQLVLVSLKYSSSIYSPPQAVKPDCVCQDLGESKSDSVHQKLPSSLKTSTDLELGSPPVMIIAASFRFNSFTHFRSDSPFGSGEITVVLEVDNDVVEIVASSVVVMNIVDVVVIKVDLDEVVEVDLGGVE